jgi:zinc D-Ala-D-Ala dipeptidase
MRNKIKFNISTRLYGLTIFTSFYLITFPVTSPKTESKSSDTAFVKLKEISKDFKYDMRYATVNNFIKQKVYDCADCVIRKEVANALIRANKVFMEQGYRIKLFDCYRPLDVQKKMWEIYPNPSYLANPHGKGSMHTRGGAIDITLVDLKTGKELDMGTGFDHFGQEAHHSYTAHAPEVNRNRKLLKVVMESEGFISIRTEWWHYSYAGSANYPVSNFKIDCN